MTDTAQIQEQNRERAQAWRDANIENYRTYQRNYHRQYYKDNAETILEANRLARKKSPTKPEPEHGSTVMYFRGCRCELCVEAKRNYQRDYMRKYRNN